MLQIVISYIVIVESILIMNFARNRAFLLLIVNMQYYAAKETADSNFSYVVTCDAALDWEHSF